MSGFSNEVYAKPDGLPLCFDLHHPGNGTSPLVVFIHGGGWISGEREMFAEEAEWFAGRGFAAAVIDYRLAPLYPYPAAVEDCEAFIEFVKENAGRYGIDPSRIAAFGNSAGGHLASCLGVRGKVAAVVDVCGLTDMREPDKSQHPISMSFIEQFMGGPYAGREETYAAASPAAHVSGASCPFLIVHGSEDDVVPPSQSEKLAEALRAHGVPVQHVVLDGEGHSFTLEAWNQLEQLAVAFLREVYGDC